MQTQYYICDHQAIDNTLTKMIPPCFSNEAMGMCLYCRLFYFDSIFGVTTVLHDMIMLLLLLLFSNVIKYLI